MTGAIWGLWHLPLVLLGHNYGSDAWLGMLVFVPLCMALSVLFTALRNLGNAIWPAALAHGVLNQLATLLTGTLLVGARFSPLIDGAAGLAGLLIFGTAAIVVYLRFGALLDGASKPQGSSAFDAPEKPLGLDAFATLPSRHSFYTKPKTQEHHV